MPAYFLNSNILISFIYRKQTPLFKITAMLFFNLFSIYIFFLHLDRKNFMNYIAKPNPYSSFMREEYDYFFNFYIFNFPIRFLKRKGLVSDYSYMQVDRIQKGIERDYHL